MRNPVKQLWMLPLLRIAMHRLGSMPPFSYSRQLQNELSPCHSDLYATQKGLYDRTSERQRAVVVWNFEVHSQKENDETQKYISFSKIWQKYVSRNSWEDRNLRQQAKEPKTVSAVCVWDISDEIFTSHEQNSISIIVLSIYVANAVTAWQAVSVTVVVKLELRSSVSCSQRGKTILQNSSTSEKAR